MKAKERPIFVKPAGRRIAHAEVAWYDVALRDLIDVYFNTGDMTVFESTLKVLNFSDKQFYYLNIDVSDDTEFEQGSTGCDYIMLRGSNYIHEDMNWGHFATWLERIPLPVMCLGVGAQSAVRRKIVLPPDGLRVWQMISERTKSIGVRGEFTAHVLNDNGIKNATIVGCPTMFRHLKPQVEVRHFVPQALKRISFSIRRETDEGYTSDIPKFLAEQRAIIERLASQYDLFLTAHGEVEEKALYYRDPLRMEEADRTLVEQGWFEPEGGILRRLYQTRLFFSTVVEHMDSFMGQMEASIGYRVHGVLPTLAQGIPAVLLKYDARSEELAQALNVPIITPPEALSMPFEEIFSRDRFSAFTANFSANYARMKAFLDDNGFANKM